jgi:hypothetical protein
MTTFPDADSAPEKFSIFLKRAFIETNPRGESCQQLPRNQHSRSTMLVRCRPAVFGLLESDKFLLLELLHG